MYCLFEKRLKANLFRAAGAGWQEEGLSVAPLIIDETHLNGEVQLKDGVYTLPNRMEEGGGYYVQRAITFDQFLKMDFDVAVTATHDHEKSLYDLLRRYKPKTKFVRQIGNIGERPLGFCRNVLLVTCEPMPSDVNYLIYHPEHYEGYCYTTPRQHKIVRNFVNCLPTHPTELADWTTGERSLSDFTFKMHGEEGRDGFIPHLQMPQTIRDSAFVWHVKGGSGGGFVLRQALASGRPCIVRRSYATRANNPEADLLHDSVNCIDLDLGIDRGIGMMREWSEPEHHTTVCKTTAEQFIKDVDFQAEAEKIRAWLENIPS
jgi:hypothetical protein